MSSGPSPEEARKALKEAVHLFLETLKEMGTLKEVLEARDPSDLYRSVRFPDQE
jgi:predicted RNase H-like HicB family nuclease